MPIGSFVLAGCRSRSSEILKIEYLILRFEVELTLVLVAGLQHSSYRNRRFIKNIRTELVEQVENIHCGDLLGSETGKTQKRSIDECEGAIEICDCDAIIDVRESAGFASLLDCHRFQHVECVDLSLAAAL